MGAIAYPLEIQVLTGMVRNLKAARDSHYNQLRVYLRGDKVSIKKVIKLAQGIEANHGAYLHYDRVLRERKKSCRSLR